MLAFPAESDNAMSGEQINYDAVLADLEARKAQLEAAIAAIKAIASQGGSGPNPSGSGPHVGPSAFLGMSIPDAAKKYLSGVKEKKPTQEIIDALVAGGLPPSKYTTVYNILTRRQKQVGDIVNMKGDWGLAEWYPNHRFPARGAKDADSEESEEEKAASF
jgi:hypothetical protein